MGIGVYHTEEKASLTAATAVPGSSPCSVAEEEPRERRSILLGSCGRLAAPGRASQSRTLALGPQKGDIFLF